MKNNLNTFKTLVKPFTAFESVAEKKSNTSKRPSLKPSPKRQQMRANDQGSSSMLSVMEEEDRDCRSVRCPTIVKAPGFGPNAHRFADGDGPATVDDTVHRFSEDDGPAVAPVKALASTNLRDDRPARAPTSCSEVLPGLIRGLSPFKQCFLKPFESLSKGLGVYGV